MIVAVNAIYAIAPNVSGFIAQLVEHRTGNREVTGSNPVEVLNFFSGFFTQLHKLRSLRLSFLHFHEISLLVIIGVTKMCFIFVAIRSSTGEDHLSPSGTIERARQAVESASRTILANRAAAASSQTERREDDSVFIERGSFKGSRKGAHGGLCLVMRSFKQH